MAWGVHQSFTKAILHVDGDSFFFGCEVALDPSLKGKPVITGRERGIAAAMSYEAKALGVTRGMTITEVLKLVPNAIILPSNYENYSLFSKRMFSIVRRYTPQVEEYSIDECFADLTGLQRPLKLSYQGMATQIKNDLRRELNMTFSIGLGPSKVLAKLGSKHDKPDGLTFIPAQDARRYLAETNLSDVWGVGPQTSAYLHKNGIKTALDFAETDSVWIEI